MAKASASTTAHCPAYNESVSCEACGHPSSTASRFTKCSASQHSTRCRTRRCSLSSTPSTATVAARTPADTVSRGRHTNTSRWTVAPILTRTSWRRETVALGTNTDPYQRAEGRYALMPGIIGALADSGTPFSILTKGTLLRRDLPLIAEAAHRVDVSVAVSLAVGDPELHKDVEPGTPSPHARLGLISAIRDAGLGCHVMVAPVLPRLTDSVEHLDALLHQIADAGATGVTVFGLHLRGSTRGWFMTWLARSHPELVGDYRELYRRGAYLPSDYKKMLHDRVTPLVAKYGLAPDRRSFRAAEAPAVAPAEVLQPTLF